MDEYFLKKSRQHAPDKPEEYHQETLRIIKRLLEKKGQAPQR